jgi:hypothetical protein
MASDFPSKPDDELNNQIPTYRDNQSGGDTVALI